MFNTLMSHLHYLKWRIVAKKCLYGNINSKVDAGFRLVGKQYIKIGDNFQAGKFLCLQAWDQYRGKNTNTKPELVIGNNVSMMWNCQISCMYKIIVGNGCLLGDNVFITDNYHGNTNMLEMNIAPAERMIFSKGPVIIGDNVWLGRNVCIMPNVKIGDGAIVGANAVVTHDIPSYSIVGGVPAKVINKNI